MNKDKRLASFLTTLLCASIIAEASLGTYVGLKLFMAKQEQEFENARYEAYLEEQEQRRENPPKIQYAGPTMRVVDGVLMDWDDHIIPDPVPVESGKTAPAVSNLEENTIEPEAAPPVQQTSKPADSNDSKADSSGSTSGNQSSGTEKPSGNSQSSGNSTSSSGGSSGGSWGEDSTTNEITGSLDKTSYWVSSGKSYHFSKDCVSLKRSKNISTGTLQEALDAGKTDPCNHCAGGS